MSPVWRKILPANRNRYKYKPLDHCTHSIRLLRILPEEPGNDLVQCEMHHADINSKYTCLYYVWGEPKPTYRIKINGKGVHVRKNLLHFLKQASQSHQSQLFWIDALCIDQDSVIERNHQVQQMGLIFNSAESVLSWLGNEKRIERFFGHPKPQGADFYDFWNSEYWNRAWITQEVTLANHLLLMAGDKVVTVETLLDQAELVSHGDHPAYYRFKVLERNALSTFKGMSLLHLLDMFKLKECERVQDRVYSLLALCGVGSDVQVDYNQSPKETLKHVMRCCQDSLCWCSVKVLHRTLKIYEDDQFDLANEKQPFVEFVISVDDKIGQLCNPASITLCLSHVCNLGSSYLLHVSPELDPEYCDIPSAWQAHWNRARYSGECMIRISGDRKLVLVQMSLSTLVELLRGLDDNGICHKSSGPTLQLCEGKSSGIGYAALVHLMEVDRNVQKAKDLNLRDLFDGHVKINLNRRSNDETNPVSASNA